MLTSPTPLVYILGEPTERRHPMPTGDPTQDPRDVADHHGLQDARDDSAPSDDWLYQVADDQPSWRDRYDTREEWEEA